MSVCCECCVLCRQRRECVKVITRPEESYQLWYVILAENVGSNLAGGMDVCVCCECCVLCSHRRQCVRLITRPEESYQLWCVILAENVGSNLAGGMDVCVVSVACCAGRDVSA